VQKELVSSIVSDWLKRKYPPTTASKTTIAIVIITPLFIFILIDQGYKNIMFDSYYDL